MTLTPRRTAGTHNARFGFLTRFGILRRRPSRDLARFDAGTSFKMVGMSKTLAGARPVKLRKGEILILRRGMIHFAQGDPITFTLATGTRDTVTLRPPIGLALTDKKIPLGRRFGTFTLTTADGHHELAFPRQDEELFHRVVQQANELGR